MMMINPFPFPFSKPFLLANFRNTYYKDPRSSQILKKSNITFKNVESDLNSFSTPPKVPAYVIERLAAAKQFSKKKPPQSMLQHQNQTLNNHSHHGQSNR
jgi:hypothetical protein